jgi:hypothetical protein
VAQEIAVVEHVASRKGVLIEGVPVQFLPAFNPLLEGALREAKEVMYEEVPIRVLPAEHLVAGPGAFEDLGLTPNEESAGNRSMKTNRLLLVITTLVFASTAACFASPMMGTWKLNESKSHFAPGATKNDTVSYTAAKHGMIKVTVDGMDKDGKRVHWTTMVKFDGKPHRVAGSPLFDTAIYTPVNERSNKLMLVKDGKVVSHGTITVSTDGKSRVVKMGNGKSQSEKAYYDKE